MTRFFSAVAGWRGYALTAVVMLAVGFATGWTVHGWKVGAASAGAEIQYRDRIIYRERAQNDLTQKVEAKAVERQAEIRTITQTLIKEVPVYVPVQADDRYVLPAGLVRLHDLAALGLQVPDAAGDTDGAAGFLEPSDTAPSRLAATIVENYGVCHADAARLSGLQEWVSKQAALANAP